MGHTTKVFTQQELACRRTTREDFGVDQALIVPLVDVLDAFAVTVASIAVRDATVIDQKVMVRIRTRRTSVPQSNQTQDFRPLTCEEWNFVLQPVAVRILVAECCQNLVKLIDIRWNVHANCIQPIPAHPVSATVFSIWQIRDIIKVSVK